MRRVHRDDLAPVRTRELLRVGRLLLSLPLLDRASCEGRINGSKLLLLPRGASPEHEAAWLERTEALPCRRLALEAGPCPR